LDAPDFLDVLAEDKDIDIIGLYIEGIKDINRFMSSINKCLKQKPVVILKAGLTGSGAGAALYHTASQTGSQAVWDAFFKETGAIQASTIDEVADILQGLTRFIKPFGNNVALVGRGGGIGVVAADICERAGLKVPPFSRETQANLRQIRPDAGAGIRNPVEPKLGMEGAVEFYLKGLPVIDADENTDIILIQPAIDIYGGQAADRKQNITEIAYALSAAVDSLSKPVAVALFTGGQTETLLAGASAREILTKAGIPVFSGVEAAARAIGKVNTFRQRKKS
jgi:acetyltransferase